MTPIYEHIQNDPSDLWLSLREVIGPELPEPQVIASEVPPSVVWNTTCYEVRIEIPGPEDKLCVWEARAKRSGIRSSGRGNPISCPTLALWLGKLCGENTRMHTETGTWEEE